MGNFEDEGSDTSKEEQYNEDEEAEEEAEENERVNKKETLNYAQCREANITSHKVICDELKVKYNIPENHKPKTVLKVLSKKLKDERTVVRQQSSRIKR